MISIITAKAKNNVIGNGNEIPWHLSSDFKYFKDRTMGHPIIMGCNTYRSIGKELPGRTNIVIGDEPGFAPSFEDALRKAALAPGAEEVFVIGGAMVYAQAIKIANRLYITEVGAEPAGDKFFPDIDSGVWREVSRLAGEKTDKDDYNFSFVTYERI